MKQYFVTGTDTGVGKTFVTCTLARLARASGQRVFAFKPIETGCRWEEGRLVGEDQLALVEAAGGWQRGDLAGVHQYAFPAAPTVSSSPRHIGGSFPISLPRIEQALAQGSFAADVVLVEGAGGWRVPVTDTLDMGGLAKRLGGTVLVVSRATLGTINHSLLTIEAVERDGLRVEALVLSGRPNEDRDFAASNASEIRRQWSGEVLQLWDDPASLAPLVERSP